MQHDALTARSTKLSGSHWLAFIAILIPAYLVVFAVGGHWAAALGYMLVPAVVGFFIIRHAVRHGRLLLPRYGIVILIVGAMAWMEGSRGLAEAEESILRGCLERNPAVAELEREEDRQSFCGCYADALTLPVIRKSAIATLTFTTAAPMADDPRMTAAATEAWTACAARLQAG